MNEQTRSDSERHAAPDSGASLFDVAPDGNLPVMASSGPYVEQLPVGNLSVSEIRWRFRDRFDIDPNSQAVLGGNDGIGQDGSGAVRRGTYGNAQIYLRRAGQDATPPLTRHRPEIQMPSDRLPTDQSCTELVASVPQILFANLAVASAIRNTLWLQLCGALHYGELGFDIADGLMRPTMPLPPSTLVGGARGDGAAHLPAQLAQPTVGQAKEWRVSRFPPESAGPWAAGGQRSVLEGSRPGIAAASKINKS